MKISHRITSAAAAGLLGTAMFVAAPGVASAADPCRLGWSNVEPRTCAMTEVHMGKALTLGNGICAGIVGATATAFDGPLYQYSTFPGATHAVELRISQGYSPLGEWAPTILACDVTAIVDWQNLDTGQNGSVNQFIPASHTSIRPIHMLANTGPGPVRLTLRTDHPNLPVSAEIFVP